MKKPDNFLSAWKYLDGHPIFLNDRLEGCFHECLRVSVWERPSSPSGYLVELGCGPYLPSSLYITFDYVDLSGDHPYGAPIPDGDLDVFDATFEEAIVRLARNVWLKYGAYEPGGGPYADLYERLHAGPLAFAVQIPEAV